MNSPSVTRDGHNAEGTKRRAPWFTSGWTPRIAWIKNRQRPRRVLFLDDDPARAETFLLEYPQAVWVQTVEDCVACLAENWDEVHLDHDLGGRTFVDTNEIDCGMEVIRWLCREPRTHLRESLFFVHTHNSVAGLMMVLQMRSSDYKAEFRPFGFERSELFAGDGWAGEHAGPRDQPATPWRRWLGWLRSWRHARKLGTGARNEPESID